MSKTSNRIVIEVSKIKISLGHSPHKSGSGPHRDKRKRKEGTRKNQIKKFLQE